MDIVDTGVLTYVMAASFVLAKFWEILKDRLPFWARLPEWGREVGGYVLMLAGGVLMWFTRLNALPGFYETGRAITCAIAALGPSAIYDCLFDKPK